jgi:hypothetical protein
MSIIYEERVAGTWWSTYQVPDIILIEVPAFEPLGKN